MQKLNWNNFIKVKLTELGKEIYRSQFDELNADRVAKGFTPFPRPEPHEDEDGFAHFQLWHFMQMYGNHIGNGFPLVVKDVSLYIDEERLEEVEE